MAPEFGYYFKLDGKIQSYNDYVKNGRFGHTDTKCNLFGGKVMSKICVVRPQLLIRDVLSF